jgi:hypothetical protein
MDMGSSSRRAAYKWNVDVGCTAKICGDLLSASRTSYKCTSMSSLPAEVLRQLRLLGFKAYAVPTLPAERSVAIEFGR